MSCMYVRFSLSRQGICVCIWFFFSFSLPEVSLLITDVGQLENMKSVEATLHAQLKGLLLVDMYDELKRLDEEKKTEEKAKILQTIESLRGKNIQIFDFEDILEKGRKAYIPPFMHQDPERIFTLVYTSGE